jgi:hypothetical protein
MYVYIPQVQHGRNFEVLGIFSSLEKASNFCMQQVLIHTEWDFKRAIVAETEIDNPQHNRQYVIMEKTP